MFIINFSFSKNIFGKSFKSALFLISLLIVLLVGQTNVLSNPKRSEILWDNYGVPHIYGVNSQDAFQAFGWAQMHSHANLLLRLYGQARGRAAEYWGEDYLESDRWVVTMGIPQRAKTWYQQQNATFRSYLDSFATGINTYAAEHPELIDDEVKTVLPISGEDVLAHVQRVLNFTFVVDPETVTNLHQKPKHSKGSNGWAIAPGHSTSGNTLLLANPHLPWFDLFLWYEAQITAPGIDAYGATLVGIPVLAIAFNDNLGWTHTVNTFDGWDIYELTLSGKGYLFDGEVRDFTTKTAEIKLKQQDGTIQSQKLTIQSSVHGPLIKQEEGKALALRVVGLDRPGVLEQWWDMAKANNFKQFEAVLQRLQLPMFTVMYADREGHIMHLFNGQVPIRSQGDFAYWQGIISGDTSTTLWTKIHPYQDLPRIVDPTSGWLQNANDPPWTTTFPSAISPEDYPPYIAPQEMDFRAQRSARMLAETDKISFPEMINYKHSTRMEMADRLLDDLIPALRQESSTLALQVADVLEQWDRQTNAKSQGAVLFAAWLEEIDFDTLFSQPWQPNSPLNTPNGLADPQQAVKTLLAVATQIEQDYGAIDVSWGEVFRFKDGNLDLPANGGPGDFGIFRVVNFIPMENSKHFQAFDGDSFVAAIEFSQPVKAMALTSYGNATQPNSISTEDQLKLFAQKQLRPIWRSRQEVEAHLVKRKIISKM
ncbi:Glutaryl-7-aminocephalosporanic-acid acylase [Stanieria cyanosphaera PCC 7437]|uniref:Glutaryl-7-aminocephalosporanic-acid acylase n=1 Tax=Stanieria cyanosphaera (strain ATCC 29371 / PCC 7437) TaxID=111780 RepID=K9XVU5_STAC7|nr:acylase [Stanieria cyanosphaera]AFZ36189.1 Glutaryl-7-aminocephalosporanic-acid acylase [Stanieria cyanosphaera PCC 7437]